MAERVFEGLANIRDLGGMSAAGGRIVRQGLLYRSDQLAHATPADREQLAQMGIAEVIDFRSDRERTENPDGELPGAVNLHLPVFEDIAEGITHDTESDKRLMETIASGQSVDDEVIDAHMQAMYRGFVDNPFAASQYARFVDEVLACAEQGRAILWHCTAGKDRAGFATAIVLEALGVDRGVIVEDYLLTNARLANMIEGILAHLDSFFRTEAARNSARRFFQADASYLEAAYAAADERYGSFEAFLEQAVGIDGDKRGRLLAYLLA